MTKIYKNNKELIIVVSIIFCLSGCNRRAKKTIIMHTINSDKIHVLPQKKLEHHRVKIDGVECALCAQAAIVAVKKIPGIEQATYQMKNNSYEDGYLVVAWNMAYGEFNPTGLKNIVEQEGFNA